MTNETKAAIAEIRAKLDGCYAGLWPEEARALLAAYDAAVADCDHGECHVTQAHLERERDALKAKLEALEEWVAHDEDCTADFKSRCTCGLSAALEGKK